MAYKFQLGAFVASGSIKAEDGVNANSAGVGAAGAIAGATSIDGSGDLTMGTITMLRPQGFSLVVLLYPRLRHSLTSLTLVKLLLLLRSLQLILNLVRITKPRLILQTRTRLIFTLIM